MNKNNTHWYFLNSGISDGRFNMSCDEYLLDKLQSGDLDKPLLRVYGWDEVTLSLGLNQESKEGNDVPVVHRISGGSSVLHGTDENEVTYSLTIDYGTNFKKLYFEIGKVLISFLSQCKLNASFGYADKNYKDDFDCFNSKTEADIVVQGIKVIGSAQARRKNNVLQHGSIKIDAIRRLSGKKLFFNEAILLLKKSFEDTLHVDFHDYNLHYEKMKIGTKDAYGIAAKTK